MLPPADYFSSICLPEVLSSLSKKKKKPSNYSVTRSSKYWFKKKKKAPIFELENLDFSPALPLPT